VFFWTQFCGFEQKKPEQNRINLKMFVYMVYRRTTLISYFT